MWALEVISSRSRHYAVRWRLERLMLAAVGHHGNEWQGDIYLRRECARSAVVI